MIENWKKDILENSKPDDTVLRRIKTNQVRMRGAQERRGTKEDTRRF
ncbi:MAG: hypothetical protein ACE5K4_10910 [Candidatus Hydrothermarchaeota archaeon]